MSSVFTKSDNEIEVKVGDPFAIELEGNPTTGYDWQLKFDSDTLELLDQHYMQKGGGLGAGGVQHSELQATKPGETTIHATYKRSWEPNALEEHTFRVKVKK